MIGELDSPAKSIAQKMAAILCRRYLMPLRCAWCQPTLGKTCVIACPKGKDVIVEVITGVMNFTIAMAATIADIDVGTRTFIQHEREILRPHNQRAVPVHIFFANQFRSGIRGERCFLFRIDQGQEFYLKIQLGRGPECGRHIL